MDEALKRHEFEMWLSENDFLENSTLEKAFYAGWDSGYMKGAEDHY